MEKDAKDYRKDELKSYVIGNILIILASTGNLAQFMHSSTGTDIVGLLKVFISSALFSSILYIYIFLIDAVVPGKLKDIIVWAFTGKPGNTIFSRVLTKNKDDRFTVDQASKAYKNIYSEIKLLQGKEKENKENAEWYRLYKHHEKHAEIFGVQKDFLLCRDMMTMTIISALGYLCLLWYLRQEISWILMMIFLLEFIVTWLAAKVKAERWAYNVIAIDIVEKDDERLQKERVKEERKKEEKPEIVISK